jgi:hypothetical protein
MTRSRRSITERGLDYTHRAERKRQIAGLRDGTPCPRCGLPMLRGQLLDLDDFPGRAYGGPQVKRLAHRACNRRAGQAITSMILRARSNLRKRRPPRQW